MASIVAKIAAPQTGALINKEIFSASGIAEPKSLLRIGKNKKSSRI